MTDDERAIRSVVADWLAATEAGDTAAVLELMTDDVVFLSPGGEPFGKEAFAAASGGAQRPRIEATAEVREVAVAGDMAYLWSALRVLVTPPGSQTPTIRSGHTLTVLRKGSDGSWRVARDANMVTPEEGDGSGA